LPGNPLIEVPYLVNYAPNSHNVYPVMMKFCIPSSLVARMNTSFDNNTWQRSLMYSVIPICYFLLYLLIVCESLKFSKGICIICRN